MKRRNLSMPMILDAATARIDTIGRNEFSLGDLADDLGVQPSALYNHTPGLDALRYAVAVRSTNALASFLTDAVVARSGADAVRAVAAAYRQFSVEHPGQYASHLLPPAVSDDELDAAQRRLVDLFSRVVVSTGIDGVEVVHVARTLRAAVHGFVALESVDALTAPVDHAASFEHLVNVLVRSLSDRVELPSSF